jgi:UDP-N-acetylmuramoyl-L-alanyl-D-glutamate--2,6-diaminopimelate ligase
VVKVLEQLLAHLPGATVQGNPQVKISQVESDSRLAGPGVLFVAVRGTGSDGHHFLGQAVEQGCVAVVHQNPLHEYLTAEQLSRIEASVQLPRTRPAPALLARQLADRPDEKLITAAVTGTNGKTTVAFLLQEMLSHLHGPCGMLGTICYDDGKDSIPAPLTTPGGPVFFTWLGRMVAAGCRSLAMELSSHALDQERCAGLSLSVAVMTNIGRDHLDYHSDIPSYVRAKARIMDYLAQDACLVINAGDDLLSELDTGNHLVLSFDPRPCKRTAKSPDLVLTNAELGLKGTELELDFRGTPYSLKSPLVGRFNVENLMAAFSTGVALGFEPVDVCSALAGINQVPGRLERFLLPGGAMAVVDYAHTHDALQAVLKACDELSSGQLLAVFGCGGDRDKGKRSLMGAVSAADADAVWITSDNPRTEDPSAICEEIAAGYRDVEHPRSTTLKVVEDRTAAVRAALDAATAGDIVVVAGKGHEDYQLVGDKVLELDDRIIIRDWIGEQELGH